jgi:AcrR family transcriptional regulator
MKAAVTTRPYRQRARALASERTRQALLDAAEREFFAGTWERSSLESIAASAGVTKQTLLRHFGSRDGLVREAFLRSFNIVRDERWAAPRGDIAGAVDNLLEHYERWGQRALSMGALDGRADVAGELGRRARQLHYDWVEHAFGPWLDAMRARTRARRRMALIALCDVHTWWLLTHDLGLARSEVRATLIDAITRLTQEAT